MACGRSHSCSGIVHDQQHRSPGALQSLMTSVTIALETRRTYIEITVQGLEMLLDVRYRLASFRVC